MTPTPIRSISLATPSITATPLSDGGVTLQSNDPLDDYETQLGELLRHWADARPDTVFLGERTADAAWRTVTYGETRTACDAISQSLLDRGLGPERPVMLLSGNAIDHGLLSFAAMQVGIPVAPVSPAYSLMSTDFAKVKLINELVKPGLVYAASASVFAKVLAAVPFGDAEIVTGDNFTDLTAATPDASMEEAFAAVTGDHVAKYLFTSGSTGTPKGAMLTHANLSINAQQTAGLNPFGDPAHEVFLGALPLFHVFAN